MVAIRGKPLFRGHGEANGGGAPVAGDLSSGLQRGS